MGVAVATGRDERGKVISGVVLYASKDQSDLYEKAKGYTFGEIVYWNTKKTLPP